MNKHKIYFFLVSVCISSSLMAQLPIVNGWTQFDASADSRLIYVSDVSGNDATAEHYLPSSPEIGADPFLPIGPIKPWKTLDAAKTQLRNGFPDWILFKRGETWTGQWFGTVTLSGRADNEPMLIGAYGDCTERANILTSTATLINFIGASASHIAITGIHATPHTYAGAEENLAVRLIDAPFSSFLIEDCFFEKFSSHIAIHNLPSYGTSRQNLKVRRCILADAYKIGGSGGGGLFIANVEDILFEENLIDHNGWNTDVQGAGANAFSHNTYFQVSNTGLVFQNNVVTRASATGGGFRCGGTILNNLFVDNPKGIQFGTHEARNGSGGGIDWPSDFKSGELTDNVVLGSRVESFEAGTGIQIQRVKNTGAQHNIAAGFTPQSEYNTGAVLNEIDNVDFHHNILYDWGNNNTSGNSYSAALACGNGIIGTNQIHHNDLQMNNERGSCVNQDAAFANTTFEGNRYFNVLSGGTWYEQWFQPQGSYSNWLAASGETGSTNLQVNYTDPARNIATYLTSIGASGDLQAFVENAKLNSQCAWDDAYTAASVNDYIRAGFDVPVPLATELIQLSARYIQGKVEISWATATADQLSGFQVQRSTDGVKWEKLADIAPNLPSDQTQHYVFKDLSPKARNYYRLKMTDFNGSFEYSNLVAVSGDEPFELALFPNPASDFIEVQSKQMKIRSIKITNGAGEVILYAEAVEGHRIPIKHLPSGVYRVEAFGDGYSMQKAFVKM